MSSITRFGISLDSELLDHFDGLIRQKGCANRSEAIRDLIRAAMVRREWESDAGEKVGTITIIYNHHGHEISEKLTQAQHEHHDNILSTMHIHLDQENCLEVLAVKGTGKEVTHIADELIGMKGVKHGRLVTTTTGKNLK